MSAFENTPPDVKELLGKRISQLGLRLEGSPVERFVHQLHRELSANTRAIAANFTVEKMTDQVLEHLGLAPAQSLRPQLATSS